MTEQTVAAEERHASWLELFFDLTVVAAAAQISHRLHGAETIGQVAACAAMFYAVWSVWTATSVYANVAGERTRQRAVLRTMLGIGVMAASVPGVFPELLPDHGEAEHAGSRTIAFTVAFVLCRGLAARSASKDGKVIGFWPATQGVMSAPWIVALFVQEETAHWLWFGGIVADLLFSVMGARNPKAMEQRAKSIRHEQETEQRRARFFERLSFGRHDDVPAKPPLITVARVERGHLDERLGLFVIIVLGEALAQVVAANTELDWNWQVGLTSFAAFWLLVQLWQLTTLYGFTPAPRSTTPLEPWAALLAHLGVTGAIVALAAGLGGLIPEAGEHLQTKERWYVFGGLALYFAISGVAGVIGKVRLRWFLGWQIPCLLVSVLVAALGRPLSAWSLAIVAAVVPSWFYSYNRLVKT
ncbi:low temperature requirement protein A [Kribbella kalugense]|uniref:Low temperature requirement protein LtrA n=1 Tax=Kribbella kalugense TaxID=2512221 RepID=A0A4R7ZB18_9ACTN|nr:low temperature requirement protein A [Kribbella kalugense]TDW13986.1 low temperature requirement protein LtrA [Kribbella kalugense]